MIVYLYVIAVAAVTANGSIAQEVKAGYFPNSSCPEFVAFKNEVTAGFGWSPTLTIQISAFPEISMTLPKKDDGNITLSPA